MKKKNRIKHIVIIFLLISTNFNTYPEKCAYFDNQSGTVVVGQQAMDLQFIYQSILDIVDQNQEDFSGETQSILDTVEDINDQIEQLIKDVKTSKKTHTKATIPELEAQIAALQLKILGLNSQLESLIVLYDDMQTGEAEIQVRIGTMWDLQIKADSFPYKSKFMPTKGFLGGIFDFLGDFDAIFGGAAAFDAAFSILFDILLDFAGGERSKMLKKYRQKIEKEIIKSMHYKKIPKTNVISQSGMYKLKTGMNHGITINANNVILDLDNNTILADSTIPISIESNKKNIIIKNGSIMGGDNYIEAPVGIEIKEGSQLILIEDVDISFCHKALHFNGTNQSPVQNCKIKNCTFDSNLKSIVLNFAIHTFFEGCKIPCCFEQAIEQNNSSDNNLDTIVEL